MQFLDYAGRVSSLTTSVSNNLDNLQFFFRERVVFPKSVFEKFQLVER